MDHHLPRDHHKVERDEQIRRLLEGRSGAFSATPRENGPPSKEESDRRKRDGEVVPLNSSHSLGGYGWGRK